MAQKFFKNFKMIRTALCLLCSCSLPSCGVTDVGDTTNGVLPTASPVTSHRYLWHADGSSANRGRGSILGWPSLTNGTATCDLSQVEDNGLLPPYAPLRGSTTLRYIKAVCHGGASGGTISIVVDMEDRSLDGIGNFGFFWHQPPITGPTAVTVDTPLDWAFTRYLRWNWATGGIGRRLIEGWNPITWQAGDHVNNIGGADPAASVVGFRIVFSIQPNTSATYFFSDFIYGYYSKPQITIWGENNFASFYTDLFPYANTPGRRLVGSYCPVSNNLYNPALVPLEGGFTNAQLQEMVAAGWTIGGESTAGLNYIDYYTLDGVEADIDQHLQDLEQLGYKRPIFWCYEDAKHNAAIDALLEARGIVAAFSGNIFSDNTGRPLYGGLVNPYNLWAVSGDARSLSEVIAAIDHAIKYGEQLGLEWQRYDSDFPPVADYLVKLRNAGLVEIVTVEKLIQRHGQVSRSAPSALLSFEQVEHSYTRSPARFAGLWSQARMRTVRIALLGDSQETSPEGKGDVYVPRLHYESWRRYGNVPETVVVGYHSYSGQTVPFGDWLLSGATAPPGASPTRIAQERLFPGIPAAAHAAAAGPQSVNGQWYGQLVVLEHDARGMNPAAQVPTNVEYFCVQGSVRAEIFAATHPRSGGIRYKAQPADQAPDYFAPSTIEETASLSLAEPAFAVKSFVTPPLPRNGKRYLQLQVLGSMTSTLTDIIGVRFISDQCRGGIVIQDLSASGLSIKDFLNRYGEGGDLFRAMGFDAAILHFGANDIGRGATAETFRADTEMLIARVRAWARDADFPVILMSDPYRKGLDPMMEREYARYPGAQRAIAEADPMVLVVNSMRLMDETGWKADRPDRLAELLLDEVHYTPRGAIELAEAEMGTLLGP